MSALAASPVMRAVLDTNVVIRTAVAELRYGNAHGILRRIAHPSTTPSGQPRATFIYYTCPELLDEFEQKLRQIVRPAWLTQKFLLAEREKIMVSAEGSDREAMERQITSLQRELERAIPREHINTWLSRNADMTTATIQNMKDFTAGAQVVGLMKHRLKCMARVVDIHYVPNLIPADPSDNKLLEVARLVGDTYLVSDDRQHVRQRELEERLAKLEPYRGIKIVASTEFSDLLKRQDLELRARARTQSNRQEVA